MPIRIIWSTDGLLCLSSATTSFWHSDAVRGPSTPTASQQSPQACASSSTSIRPPHGSEPYLREDHFSGGRPKSEVRNRSGVMLVRCALDHRGRERRCVPLGSRPGVRGEQEESAT